MAKTVEISFQGITKKLTQAKQRLKKYFANIDTNGIIAVGAIGVGLVLVVIGIILV
ncbi:hypothetical protein K9M74_05570 [Candidatus Woesearchaeota archaeon]|nr:hypothetical protein [Candidatus Woesearchaeota archaeon]